MGNEQNKISASTRVRAAQFGLTITDQAQFELAADVDVVLFNKAGTLTAPVRRVVKSRLAYSSPLATQSELLALAAGVEVHTQHPIAQSIVEEAERQKLDIPNVFDVRGIPGLGVTGVLDGQTILIGGPGLLTSRNIPIYVDDLVRADAANGIGHTVVYVIQNSQLIGMIELSETVLPEAIDVVNQLHARKIRVAMVTGDATGVAQHVADQLRIAEVFAEIVPSRKADVVRKLDPDRALPKWRRWLIIRDVWITLQESIHGKDNLTCAICGKTGLKGFTKTKTEMATIDHIKPVSAFPELWNNPSNFQLACYRCNQNKGCSH